MNPVDEIFIAGGIVVIGTWTEGHTITPSIPIGIMVTALGTAVLYDLNQQLGEVLATGILVGAVLRYVGPVFTKALGNGLKATTEKTPGKKSPTPAKPAPKPAPSPDGGVEPLPPYSPFLGLDFGGLLSGLNPFG